jgi:hypothetical protein
MRHEHPRFQQEMSGTRLDVFALGSGKRLWGVQYFPKPVEYPLGYTLSFPGMPLWDTSAVDDLRWSRDARYLSYTQDHSVHVVSAREWEEVMTIPKAEDAFLVRDATQAKE